ncbi:MAG: UDP-N-acetylmuramoyl-tripeptide--D-alanyl-D-alanine ligase [Aquificota bacterium]|nr:UDP-N-acetylmuramoyl-tripeptide--D-alanyl-D-alanine ligase [Aquificota bacterium]
MKVLDVAKAVGGTLRGRGDLETVRVCTDSRLVLEGDLFVALKGSRFDGHDFIGEAFSRGAVCAVSERDTDPPEGKALIKVQDTLEALRRLAVFKRSAFSGTVVGITGSAGKTTTKELTAYLLSEVGPTYRSYGNLNSQIGVPLVLANMPPQVKFAVIEMGASRLGEMGRLVSMVGPKIRVLTALGEEHLEGFRGMEGVVKENGEIFRDFSREDFAVLPAYAVRLYDLPRGRFVTFGEGGDLRAEEVRLTESGTEFTFRGEKFRVPVLSLGIVDNVLASFGVLTALGYDPRDFRERVQGFRGVEGRMRLLDFGEFRVIDDTYNANPPSVKNALLTLAGLETRSRKIAVLGDMLELGPYSEELHREIGSFSADIPIDLVIFYGRQMMYAHEERLRRGARSLHFLSMDDLVDALLKWACCKNIILLKGSRGMGMERILDRLRELKGYER